jgi:oxalyl-CoA decarboxylase
MDSGRPTLVNAVIDENAGTESGRIGNLNPQSVVGKKQVSPPAASETSSRSTQ